MNSGNIFSPKRVPPPFLLRNERPSSAARAEREKLIKCTRSPTAVGSSTTVYLPGSSSAEVVPAQAFLDRPFAQGRPVDILLSAPTAVRPTPNLTRPACELSWSSRESPGADIRSFPSCFRTRPSRPTG